MTSTSATTGPSNSFKEKPIGPHDCTLLICVPLHKATFIEDLKPDCPKDFVKHFRRGRESLSKDGLWGLYEPYARLALDVAGEAKQRGVQVCLDATAEDFANELMKRDATTLVAHWRSPLFRAADVLGLVEKADELDEKFELVAGFSSRQLTSGEIASKLNEYLERELEPCKTNGSAPAGALSRRIKALHEKRRYIEERLPGCFQGGSAVEFADGLLNSESVVRRVPENYSGILDLTVCNSVLLGEEIRKKCDHALVFRNEESASFDFRFALYRQVIRALAQKPQSFTDAQINVRNMIGRILK